MIGKITQRILVLILLAALLGACRAVSSSPQTQEPNEPTAVNTYPGVATEPGENQAYPIGKEPPTQEDFFPESIEIPTPSKDSGVVTGKLLIEGSREAYLGANLVLGETVEADQPGYPPLVGFSEEDDPKAVIAKDGSFLFANVPAGKYGLVMTNPLTTNLIDNPETGESLIITVVAGTVTDLGELFVK